MDQSKRPYVICTCTPWHSASREIAWNGVMDIQSTLTFEVCKGVIDRLSEVLAPERVAIYNASL